MRKFAVVLAAIAALAVSCGDEPADVVASQSSENSPSADEAASLGSSEGIGNSGDAETPKVPDECAELDGGDLRRCQDDNAANAPIPPPDLPDELQAEVDRLEDRYSSCREAIRAVEGLVDPAAVADSTKLAAVSPRANGDTPIVLSCGSGDPDDLLVVGKSDSLPAVEDLDRIVRNWLEGNTSDEEDLGLFTPLVGAARTLDTVEATDGHVVVSFSDELLATGGGWGLPGWLSRFETELGWQVALAEDAKSLEIRVGGACYDAIRSEIFEAEAECEPVDLADAPVRQLLRGS